MAQPSAPQEKALMEFYHHLKAASTFKTRLPSNVQDRIWSRFADMFARLQDEIMKHWNPTTLDEIRSYEPSLCGHALVYLLRQHARRNVQDSNRQFAFQLDKWNEYIWDDDRNVATLLADPHIRTIEDVIAWLVHSER